MAENGNFFQKGKSGLCGTKKRFRIFRGANNKDAENKNSKHSTAGDKAAATCTASSSKTFLSEAMTTNNKKLGLTQTTATAAYPVGNTQVRIPHVRIEFRAMGS